MNKQTGFLPLFALLICLASSAFSQIGIRISVSQTRFLKYEPVEITLSLRNYSGNTLVFGRDAQGKPLGKIRFTVRTQSGSPVTPLMSDVNLIDNLIFAPGQSRELKLPLNVLYNLQGEDFYNVRATVEHKRISHAFESNQLTFDVREGTVIYKKTVGLPAESEDSPIKSVTATLMRFGDPENDVYCLRLDDDERVYGTFRIGPYIQGSKPQMDADEGSAIHVLIQIRPRLYKYAVYSIVNGVAKQRIEKYFVPDIGVPTLSRSTGYLKVLYARQAQEGIDFQYEKNQNRN